jgi:hypothetical protein
MANSQEAEKNCNQIKGRVSSLNRYECGISAAPATAFVLALRATRWRFANPSQKSWHFFRLSGHYLLKGEEISSARGFNHGKQSSVRHCTTH